MSAREKVAKAIWDTNPGDDEFGLTWQWNDAKHDDVVADALYAQADAAIAAHLEALKADGYAVVKLRDRDEWWRGAEAHAADQRAAAKAEADE